MMELVEEMAQILVLVWLQQPLLVAVVVVEVMRLAKLAVQVAVAVKTIVKLELMLEVLEHLVKVMQAAHPLETRVLVAEGEELEQLLALDINTLKEQRYSKYRRIGRVLEGSDADLHPGPTDQLRNV
jgi:hypothetical protein